MNKRTKSYYAITSSLFAVVAVLHGVRALYGWDMYIAGVFIPIWLSWLAAAITGYLAFRGSSALRKK